MSTVVEYGLRRTLIVTSVLLAVMLQTLDLTIVNVALPTIQGNLGAALDTATWVVTGYIIPAVVVIPLTPWLQMRLGRKRYFLICIGGFTAASLCCGLAPSIGALIAFRVVQGAFGGGLMATAQAILRDTFAPSSFGLSQSLYMIGIIVGPSTGPLLGGVLTDSASWQWVFLVNLVPGVLAFTVLLALLRDPGPPRRLPFDAPGVALLALGVGSLQYVLEQGERWDWLADPNVRTASILAAAGLVAFVLRERAARAPIVDLGILSHRAVAVGAALMFVNAFTIYGQQFLMPQYLSGSLGYTATGSGVTLVVRALPIAVLTIPIGMIAGRYVAPWLLVAAGFAISAVSDIALAQVTTTLTPFALVAWPLAATGVGLALINTPLMISVIGAVHGPNVPKATALVNLSMQLGGSVASSALVTLVDRREAFHQSVLAAGITLRSAVLGTMHAGGLAVLAREVGSQALAMAYGDGFWLIGACTVLAVPASAMLRRRAPRITAQPAPGAMRA